MILVDTSVWVDYIRAGDDVLTWWLQNSRVLAHPHVIGEVLLGGPKMNSPIAKLLFSLQKAQVATDDEVLGLISTHKLAGSGIGYVDSHIIAAARLTHGAKLLTRDTKLYVAAARLGVEVAGSLH